MIVYSGPSQLDPATPIVAVLTGLHTRSTNPKTGSLTQLWILVRDQSPLAAIDTGGDHAICGDCKLRGSPQVAMGRVHYQDRSCYVQVKNAPLSIWRKYQRGGYPVSTPAEACQHLRARGLGIRLGAYGDPAALPIDVLHQLTDGIRFTGYTHQWAACDPAYRARLMASVDTPEEQAAAHQNGWRTFRVRLSTEQVSAQEITCPASAEAGHRTTCDRCVLCAGTSRPAKSIAIVVHGAFAGRFIRLREAAG